MNWKQSYDYFSLDSRFSIFVSFKNLHLWSKTFKAQISATFHYYRGKEKEAKSFQMKADV